MNTNEVQEKSLIPADEPLYHAMRLYDDSFRKYPEAAYDAIKERLIAADISDARQHLNDLPQSEMRGLTLDTLRHFNCGYFAQWTLPDRRAQWLTGYIPEGKLRLPKKSLADELEKQCISGAAMHSVEEVRKAEQKRISDAKAGKPYVPPPSERIIIPTYSDTHFNAVCTPSARSRVKEKHWKQHAGSKEIFFDPDALVDDVLFPDVKDVVVVEGELDCMSIWQATGGSVPVVALLGCRPKKDGGVFGEYTACFKGKRYVILLDGDEAGRKGANDLVNQLQSEFISAKKYFLADYLSDEERRHPENNKFDANEFLQRGQEDRLKEIIEKIMQEAHADLDAIEQRLADEKVALGNNPPPELIARHSQYWQQIHPITPKSDKPLSPDIEALLDTIKESITPDDLEAHGFLWHSVNGGARPNGYCCPKCNSGDKAHKTGALSWTLSPIPLFHCHACGFGGSVINFLANAYDVGTRGKDFFTLLRRIADEFGIPYKPEIFDREARKMNQTTNQTTLPDDTPEAVKNGISAFETENGKINPDVIPKICAAAQKIDALTLDTLTAADVVDFTFLGSLGTLKFYMPTKYAEFIEQYKKLGKPPIPVSTLEGKVLDSERKRRREHKDYCKELSKQLQAEAIQRTFEAKNEVIAYHMKQIETLRQQPQSPERDAQIVSNINDCLDWKLDKQGAPVSVKPTAANINLIFTFDPDLDGLVGYDEFERHDVYLKSPPWNHDVKRGAPLTDRDDAHFRKFIRNRYTDFNDQQLVADSITEYADANKFHVIRQYFENLPKWDGVPRAEKYFIDLLLVEDTPYAREITLKWLLGAVARVFEPGCNFPWSLVLQGAQGIGKSRSIHLLGGKWHKVLSYSVDDPHAVDALKNSWLVEIEEFSAVRKAEVNAMKSFISRSSDNQRAAYARRTEDVPRQCVFVATVNDAEFLTDRTGNRRFSILRTRRAKGDCFEAPPKGFIAQVWGEVFSRYNEMFADGFDVSNLELSDETKRISESVAQEHMRDDGLDGEISAFVDMKIPPRFIWDLLSKEERRAFFANGGRLEMESAIEDFSNRRRSRGGRQTTIDNDVAAIEIFLRQDKSVRYCHNERLNAEIFTIYGSELRTHIFTAEIFNEYFGNDRRKTPQKISEILQTLEGWHKGERLPKFKERVYGDQRNVFYRDADNVPDADTKDTAAPSTGINLNAKGYEEPDLPF